MNFEEIYKNVPKPHIPEKLPVELSSILYDCEIIKLISKANNAIGVYRGFLINTINPMLLISPLVSQEAVLSSKLEGTHATIEDFINYDAGNEVSISKDEMQEIMNYRSALFYALDKMSPLSDDGHPHTVRPPGKWSPQIRLFQSELLPSHARSRCPRYVGRSASPAPALQKS